MSLITLTKNLSIAAGLFRPALRLSRCLRPSTRQTHLDNVRFYRSLLPSGCLCFDVGANLGKKSEAMLEAGCRVVAFEPNPLVVPELRARCGHQSRWTLVQAGLGKNAAILTLYARQLHGHSSFAKDWGGGALLGAYHVPVVTLDAAVEAFGLPFYCKIDVEGWEPEVLSGLSQSVPLLSFEFHLTDREIAKTLACLKYLANLGATHANAILGEGTVFCLPEWVSLDSFCQSFPDNLKRLFADGTTDCYGDIFVRNISLLPKK